MGILKNLLVTGAARFINTIKGSITHAQNGMYYGTCTTAAGTAAKVVNLVDPTGFELKPGVMIAVKFTYSNTASSVTFNVEGTGAKQIWYNTGAYTGTSAAVLGTTNRTYFYVYDGTYWCIIHKGFADDNYYPSAYCTTAAGTAAKTAACTNYTLTANTYLHFNVQYSNTVAGAITMNVNSKGAKPIYINGAASSSSNHTLPAGSYIAYYNGTYWHFRTDGIIPANVGGTSDNVRGTVAIANGGTSATTAAGARTNLGLDSIFLINSYTYSYTVGANATLNLTYSDFGITIPTGYTVAGVLAAATGDNSIVIRSFNGAESSNVLSVRNLYSSSLTKTATVKILLIKSEFIG